MSLLTHSLALRPPPRGQTRSIGGLLPRIDWSHPLSRNLIFYGYDGGSTAGYFGGGAAGNAAPIIDLATSNQTASRMGSSDTPTLSGTPYGPAYTYNANNSVTIVSTPAIQAATAAGNFTFACAFIKTGAVGSFSRPFGRTANNGASAPYLNWDFEINANGVGQNDLIADCNNAGTLNNTTHFTGLTDNTYTTAVCTLSGTQMTLYVNGVSVGQAFGQTPASLNTQDNIMFGGASSASVTNTFVGVIFWGAFWGRSLSVDETQMLHLAPYSLLSFDLDELPTVPWLAGAVGGGAAQARALMLA